MSQRRAELSSLSDEHLACRTIGHAWDPVITTVAGERRAKHRWEVLLQCSRCGSQRADLVDSQGRMVGRGYQYAEGYRSIPYKDYGGVGLFKQEARKALFTRLARQAGR